ncbi:MAG TPA: S8 family serine peptidase [Chitinophagaceae bacterium]
MKFHPIPLITVLLLLSISTLAQNDVQYRLQLQNGSFIPEKNITAEKLNAIGQRTITSNGKSFIIIQFEKIPGEAEKKQLQQAGIELLEYIPGNAYTASVTGTLNTNLLLQTNARAIVELTPQQKMQPALANGNFPAYAMKVAGTIDVWISFPKTFSLETMISELRNRNFDINDVNLSSYRVLGLRVAINRLNELAALPFIEYVQVAPAEDKPLSPFWTNWGRDGVRSSILSAPISKGGKNLKGQGIVIGVGDDADPQLHVDFTKRLISRAAGNYSFHGTHVTGIAGGAGIKDELRTGFAPKSTIVSQIFSGIFFNAPAYVTDYGMVITNNSYGNNTAECASFGVYDLYSRILDQQAQNLPNLQSVFAAGNSGLLKCAPFPDSFRTVLGGYQSAKNIICVGNATPLGYIFRQSSRGPVRDGRIKPEIVAVGSFIESTAPTASLYGENTGTSMASPAISGGIALLYEKYKLLHPPGLNPKNGLIKALVCNSGDDWGQPGPDYTHGFGVANFWRAVTMLEDNHYIQSSIPTGSAQTHTITVPAGVAELKVMLYWNDPAASVLAAQTLVNDLDLEVVSPSSVTILPLVLDTTYTNIKNPAVNGVDHINNIEQVVIKNPAAGNYTIRIKPTSITQSSSQEYFIAYDFVPLETRLVSPIGGESYLQGENMIVRWDSYGDPKNTFTLEYRINAADSWTVLKNNIEAGKREYFYTAPDPDQWFIIPQVTTDQAQVRITRNGTGLSSTSLPFTISDTINVSLSPIQCEGYLSIDWTTVAGATAYEIMMLQGDEMVTVATVSNSTFSYTFSGLSKDSTYWASVRPLIGASNSPGRRGIAVSRKPNSGTCAGNISNNDIKIDSIVSPLRSGRLLTSSSLGSNEQVIVRIKNLDDVPTTGDVTVSYILNNGTPVIHTITNPAIAGGGTLLYTFPETINMSAAGIYNLEVTITLAGDPVLSNNKVINIYKQLNNPPITGLLTPFVDNFDAAAVQTYTSSQIGLQDLDRYDFVNSNALGRIRTFVNSGISNSGNRAITLDASITNAGTIDSLTGTFNLATFNAATDDIRLDFAYKNHGQVSNPANKVWVRGNDNSNWVVAYDLYANQNAVDASFKKTPSIELGDLLFNASPSQTFSTSFQVRWGQFGTQQAVDNYGGAGYTFDDIRLYKVIDDMQMLSIDTPAFSSCGLTANTPVKISIRNSSNAIVTNVPVRFRVDGGAWLNLAELVPSIPANGTVSYTFTAAANLSAFGQHLIEAVVDYSTDTYRVNDTARVIINNTPVINITNSTPYLQNFEASNGYWYSAGQNNSWEYGTPSSYYIKRAASGSKAWKTRLSGNYNDMETSYLYSPCFDISTLASPTLSFSIALDLEDCGSQLCDGAYVEYSKDGKTWARLGASGQGTNWYNKTYFGNNLWSIQNYTRWHVATIPLSVIPIPVNQLTQLRFRFVVTSDAALNRDGVAIDDIHIYDNTYGIYTGATMGSPVTQTINGGSNWVDFIASGKLVASVKPANQSMGAIDVQAYIHTGSVRNYNGQYYHNRNITIKPATTSLTDSATVRFYFLDAETEALLAATGCSSCTKPAMAYELGVSKYSDSVDVIEDGDFMNNKGMSWSFINAAKAVKVPFDKGYYAEFKVKDFSEFWLNAGPYNYPSAELLSFTATKTANNKDVFVEWKTSTELNINRYEIEVAKGNNDFSQNIFVKIGEVNSLGNSPLEQRYNFTDLENNKTGVRYYRLKIVGIDGSFRYTEAKPVIFTEELNWQVFPNPSTGLFNLLYQLENGGKMTVKVYDAAGKVVYQTSIVSNGFLQKLNIDLGSRVFASGLYLIETVTGNKRQAFKIVKN